MAARKSIGIAKRKHYLFALSWGREQVSELCAAGRPKAPLIASEKPIPAFSPRAAALTSGIVGKRVKCRGKEPYKSLGCVIIYCRKEQQLSEAERVFQEPAKTGGDCSIFFFPLYMIMITSTSKNGFNEEGFHYSDESLRKGGGVE